MGKLKGFGFALLCALIACTAYIFGIFFSLDNMLQDTIYQRIRPLDQAIYIIGIDEPSLQKYGPWGTWSREVFADLLDTLNSNETAKPAAIGIDVMFFGDGSLEADARLAQSASEGGNVVTSSMVKYTSKLTQNDSGGYYVDDSFAQGIQMPYDALLNASVQGHINTQAELDGIVRNSIHEVEVGDKTSYSFAYELYKIYAKKHGLPEALDPPLDGYGRFPIPFAGKSGAFNEGIGVGDVLSGEVDPSVFADSIVLIGPYEAGMQDAYYTAIDKSTPMYGVEIHANVLQSLLEENFKRQAPFFLQACLLFFAVLGSYFVFKKLDMRLSAIILALFVALYFVACVIAYRYSYILSVIYIPFFVTVLFLIRLAQNYLSERRRRKSITDTFKKYVAPTIVDDILKQGGTGASLDVKLGGAKRDIAVLFTDIRGFTTLSEMLEPEQIVEVLNEYFSLATNAIFSNGGTVDKFIGDSAMALFNAPFDQDDYVYCAVKTALEIQKGAKAFDDMIKERYGKSLGFGIGVNCGAAVVGNIGTQYRMDYTAIGDTVNTAARLESKAGNGEVLISDSVYERLKGRINAEAVGEIPLKGKSNVIFIYKVISCV